MRTKTRTIATAVCLALLLAVPPGAAVRASSHREAPFITKLPKVDSTDLYMFRSYEAGREEYVTLIANYQPFQDPFGGPNYFTMDPEALYEIHIDNSGDAKEDITFQFRFQNALAGGDGLKVNAGGKMIAVPLINIGPISAADTSNLNVLESYTVKMVRGDRRTGTAVDVANVAGGATSFKKPTDYIGTKTFGPPPGYANYAAAHIYTVSIPGCTTSTKPAKLFVGQRQEPFAVNVGVIFDLVNAPPAVITGGNTPAGRAAAPNPLDPKSITTLALEVPASCLKGASDVISGWQTASVRQARVINPRATYAVPSKEGGPWAQVSRLGMPLVNEVVIGLKDKDRWNTSQPKDDGQFADYVTNPSLAELLEILFGAAGVMAPNKFPRTDLVAVFLNGVDMVNKDGSTAEMMRLNTAIAPKPKGSQNSLGAALCFVAGVLTPMNPGCDTAGFPNGRRPGDDVVDIELRVMMGFLLPPADAPSGQLGFTDAVLQEDSQFDATFPYLRTPKPGAP